MFLLLHHGLQFFALLIASKFWLEWQRVSEQQGKSMSGMEYRLALGLSTQKIIMGAHPHFKDRSIIRLVGGQAQASKCSSEASVRKGWRLARHSVPQYQ